MAWVASVGVYVAGCSYSFSYTDKLLPFTYNMLVLIWSCLGAGIDLLLTITLIMSLRKSVLAFNPNTDGAIKMIMRTALQTASYTTVLSVAAAVMSALPSTPLVNSLFAFEFPLASLYALSFLTTLDSRKPIKCDAIISGSHHKHSLSAGVQTKTATGPGKLVSGLRSQLRHTVADRLSRGPTPAATHGARQDGAPTGELQMPAIRVVRSVEVQVDDDRVAAVASTLPPIVRVEAILDPRTD